MAIQRIVYKECELTGDKGLFLKQDANNPNIYGSNGTLIAHDIIEHQKGMPVGTYENEFMALGGAIVVRYEMDNSVTLEGIANDCIGMLEGMHRPVKPCKVNDLDCYSDYIDDILELIDNDFGAENKQNIGRWIMKGIRAAKRRFQGYAGYDMFRSIERVCNELLDSEMLFEGAEYVLKYSVENASIFLEGQNLSEY